MHQQQTTAEPSSAAVAPAAKPAAGASVPDKHLMGPHFDAAHELEWTVHEIGSRLFKQELQKVFQDLSVTDNPIYVVLIPSAPAFSPTELSRCPRSSRPSAET